MSTTHTSTTGNGTSGIIPPHLDAREELAGLVDLASDLDALLEASGDRLPLALVGALRLDLQRTVDRLARHRRRLRATTPRR